MPFSHILPISPTWANRRLASSSQSYIAPPRLTNAAGRQKVPSTASRKVRSSRNASSPSPPPARREIEARFGLTLDERTPAE